MAKNEIERNTEYKEYERCRFDHVFIDVDSCLVGIEGIDELARMNNCIDEVEKLTKLAMNGDVPFDAVFENRLTIIKPHTDDLIRVGEMYLENITPNASDIIRRLKLGGVTVWLISGGYDEAIYPLADFVGVNRTHVLANHLLFNTNGEYQGFDCINPLCRKMGKRECITKLKEEGLVIGKVAIIGDGMSEMETKGIVDICIGFGGHVTRDKVKNRADVFITEPAFTALVPILFKN